MEAVIAVVIAVAAVAIVAVGNAEHALDRADGAADTRTDDTSDGAAHGTRNAIALIGPFLRTAHDALGVAGLRQGQQGEQDGGCSKEQAGGQANRQLRGGDTGFVHTQSPGGKGGGRRLSR